MLIDTSSTNGSTAMLNPRYIPEMPRSTKVMGRTNKRNRTVEISSNGLGIWLVDALFLTCQVRVSIDSSFLLIPSSFTVEQARDTELRMLWSGPGSDRHIASLRCCGVGLDPNSCQRGCQTECQIEECQTECQNIVREDARKIARHIR